MLRENPTEMQEHQHHRVLQRLKPERPLRQSCVVSLGGLDALNLPLEFLFGVILLEFDDMPRSKYTLKDLFPSSNDDRFLSGLLQHLQFPENVTKF